MYIPYSCENINLNYGAVLPSTSQTFDTYSFNYWERALFQRAMYGIELHCDDFIAQDKNFLLYCLFKYGFVVMWDDETMGFVFQPCTLSGYNFYYQPSKVIVSNPMLNGTKELEIGTDCEIVQLTPDYMGIWDIITYYAKKLSTLDPAVDVSITNSKVPFIAWGKNRSALQSFRKLFDKINKGETSVFIDTRVMDDEHGKSPMEFMDRPHLKESYITDKLLMDRQTLLQEFDREVGIATVPYHKKERMTEYESESSKEESQARVTIWIECLNESLKKVNAHYNKNFYAERRSMYGNSDRNIDRIGDLSK